MMLCSVVVLEVSKYDLVEGEHAANITVWLLPPKLSSNRYVNLEDLYGIWALLRVSVRALITVPSMERDWLIAIASFRVSPAVTREGVGRGRSAGGEVRRGMQIVLHLSPHS